MRLSIATASLTGLCLNIAPLAKCTSASPNAPGANVVPLASPNAAAALELYTWRCLHDCAGPCSCSSHRNLPKKLYASLNILNCASFAAGPFQLLIFCLNVFALLNMKRMSRQDFTFHLPIGWLKLNVSANMSRIDCTFCTSQFEISLLNFFAPINIPFMLVTVCVFQWSMDRLKLFASWYIS